MSQRYISPRTVETIASKILAVVGADNRDTYRVDVESIASAADCDIQYVTFNQAGVSARVTRNLESQRYLIEVNAAESVARRRFSIAHEVAHALLHDDGPQSGFEFVEYRQMLRSAGADSWKEVQANMLAAALLMPQPEVEACWRNNPDIDDLALAFGVSRDAAYWRVNNLDLLND